MENLCLQCGLCCNGVLFADVRRERGDRSPLFQQHGPRVPQPCPAFNAGNCQCAVYTERPNRCRQFECKQLLAAQTGEITPAAALKKIRAAKKLAAQIDGLLEGFQLAQTGKNLPLSKRFQAVQRAADQGKLAADQFEVLADLQLAVHQLHTTLAQDFYA